jgi:hypothetical protein
MIKAELEKLIRMSLVSLGAEECPHEEGVLHYRLTDGLSRRIGRDDLLITFSSSVAAHRENVELISAGSFMYDLILRLVRENGRVATGWLPENQELDAPAIIARTATRLQGRRFVLLKRSREPIYLFTFRLGFYFDTPHEKLYTVRVDPGRGRVRHEIHPERLLDDVGISGPAPEAETPHIDPERAFRLGWGKVEEEVSRLTEKYTHRGETHLNEEIQTIEAYYRQLIDEEKKTRLQRNTKKGRDESDERIELLKLEWDRRIAEEKRRSSPEVSVILSCASCLYTPVEKWRAKPGRGTREIAADFWFDRHSGETWQARSARSPKRVADDRPAAPENGAPPGPGSPEEAG